MLELLEARGVAAARAAQARAIARGAARIEDAIPGVAVIADDAAIVLTGRGLQRRLIDDARLRWIGSVLR